MPTLPGVPNSPNPFSPGGSFNPNPTPGTSNVNNPGSGTGYYQNGKWVDTGSDYGVSRGGSGGGGGHHRSSNNNQNPNYPKLPTVQDILQPNQPSISQLLNPKQQSIQPTISDMPKSAVYVASRDLGNGYRTQAGYYTSDQKFYPDTGAGKKYLPRGYEQGFADIRTNKDGTQIIVIPEKYVPYAKSTNEGVDINIPIEQKEPTTKFYSDISLQNVDSQSFSVPQKVTIGGPEFTQPQMVRLNPRDTLNQLVNDVANIPSQVGTMTEKGWNILLKEDLGLKDYTIKGSTRTVPQKVTIGGPEFTQPSFISPDITLGPSTVASTFGKTAELGTYLIPVVGETFLAGQLTKGSLDIARGNIKQGLSDIGFASLGLFGAKAISKTNKLFSTEYKITQKELSIPEAKPQALLGKPISSITVTDIFGNKISKAVYPYEITGRLPSYGKMVNVEVNTPLRKIFKLKPLTYLGNPYKQPSLYKSLVKNLVGTKATGYKALTQSNVKDLLRYQSPKNLPYYGSGFAEAYFGLTKEPLVYMSGKTTFQNRILNQGGIKTRGFNPFELDESLRGIKLPKSGAEYYQSLVEQTKSFLKEGRPYSKLSRFGKTTETFSQYSGAKLLKEFNHSERLTFGGEALLPAELYLQRSLSKKVLPSGRLSRKIYPSESKLTVIKGDADLIVNVNPNIKVSYEPPFPFGAKYDIFSKDAGKKLVKDLESIYKVKNVKDIPKVEQTRSLFENVKSTAKNIGNIGIKFSNNLLLKTKSAVQSLISSPVVKQPKVKLFENTLEPQVKSEYFGKGTYEKSIGGLSPGTLEVKSNESTKVGVKSLSKVLSTERLSFSEKLDIREKLIEKTSSGQTQKLFTDQAMSPAQNTTFIEKLNQSQKVTQQQRVSQRESQNFKTRFNVNINPKPIKPKLVIGPKPKDEEDEFTKSFFKPKRKAQRFIPEIRRRGKFISLSPVDNPRAAENIAKSIARTTLGASIRVKGPKGYIPLAPGKEFGTAKRSPFILVQRKTQRLGSFGERKEIIKSRKGGFGF